MEDIFKRTLFLNWFDSNRGDCASVRGIARELAAKVIFQNKIREINNQKETLKVLLNGTFLVYMKLTNVL